MASALTSTTANRPAGRRYDSQVGFGIVNAAAALAKAGKLAARPARPAGRAAAQFGGGPAAVPAAPVRPRGAGQLVLFVLLALTRWSWSRRRHPAGRPAPSPVTCAADRRTLAPDARPGLR